MCVCVRECGSLVFALKARLRKQVIYTVPAQLLDRERERERERERVIGREKRRDRERERER